MLSLGTVDLSEAWQGQIAAISGGPVRYLNRPHLELQEYCSADAGLYTLGTYFGTVPAILIGT